MTTFILKDKTEKEVIEEQLGLKVKYIASSRGRTYVTLEDNQPVTGNTEKNIQDLFKNKNVEHKPDHKPRKPKPDFKVAEKGKWKNLPPEKKLSKLKVELRHYLTAESEIKHRTLKAKRGASGRKQPALGSVTPLITQTRERIEALLSENEDLRSKYREPHPLKEKKARS